MKKFCIVAIVSFMLCLLTACGAASPAETSSTTEPVGTTSVDATEPEVSAIDPYVEMLKMDPYEYFSYKSYENDDFAYMVYSRKIDEMYYVIIDEYKGTSASVTIPDSIDGYPVIGFYHNIFEGCSFVEDIQFPDTLRTVIMAHSAESEICMNNTKWYQNQPEGIYYAGNIAIGYKGDMPENTTLSFREGTVGIGGYAFYKQENLVGVDIPESMLMISSDAFAGCGLEQVTIPQTLQYYNGAFSACNELTHVTIEEGVTEICGTFSGSSLSEVSLPSTLATIGESAFMRCEELKTLVLPDSVRTIKKNAFYASGLTHIELNDGLEYIGNEAFMGCRDMKSVFVPASARDIGLRVFGFIYEDTLVSDFVAYFEEECSYMEYLTNNGVHCEISTRTSAS